MTIKLVIIMLFTISIYSAYQWGYTDGMTSTIDRDILLMLSNSDAIAPLEILADLNFGRDREIGFGSLYPALNRLEKQGLIVGIEKPSEYEPQRKLYQLALYKPSNPQAP